jgi:hypothetical protein
VELAHAFITVFALSCNLDRFQDRVVGGLSKKTDRLDRDRLVAQGPSVSLSNVREPRSGRLFSALSC